MRLQPHGVHYVQLHPARGASTISIWGMKNDAKMMKKWLVFIEHVMEANLMDDFSRQENRGLLEVPSL